MQPIFINVNKVIQLICVQSYLRAQAVVHDGLKVIRITIGSCSGARVAAGEVSCLISYYKNTVIDIYTDPLCKNYQTRLADSFVFVLKLLNHINMAFFLFNIQPHNYTKM